MNQQQTAGSTHRPRWAWAFVLGVASAGALGRPAEAQRPRSRPAPALPPRIRTDLAPVTEVHRGQELTFHVEARDPDGWRVDLTLLNPPPGLVFDPVRGARSPATVTARWNVWNDSVGPLTLVFEARDATGLRTRLERVIETRTAGTTGLLSGDVTGDGVLDVIGIAGLADVEDVVNAGAIYVWAGASAPSGVPTATLRVPGATSLDGLGSAGYVAGQPVKLADVTGDGIADVVALASEARVGGVRHGTIHVFAGGAGLVGSVVPHATLTAPAANGLGKASGDGMLLFDLTGDGVRDVVAAARAADVGGVRGAGAIFLFAGGAGLQGARGPDATLSLPGAEQDDFLCHTDGQGLLIGDVTGDGAPDLVAGTTRARVGLVRDAGMLAVWAGGGVPTAPHALMSVPGARGLDRLGSQRGLQGVRLADVTDDGVLDVVAGAYAAEVVGVHEAGAIYVFEGGDALSGAVAPMARLRAPNPGPFDYFGPDRAEGFRIADVTGDGRLEVIAVAPEASVRGADAAGALFVFHVGPRDPAPPTLPALPNPAPIAILALADARADDRLAGSFHRGLYLRDVSRDGILDLVTVSDMEVAGVVEAGAIHVFLGGALAGAVAPAATLTAESAQAYDRLGGFGLRFEDLTRDGTLDVVADSSGVDAGALRDVGAIHVFAGDREWRGALRPVATMRLGTPTFDDFLRLVAIADVTGDGVPEVVADAGSDVDRVSGAGAIYLFAAPFVDVMEPAAMLLAPSMRPLENLRARRCVDVTGDGVLDVLGVASTSGLVTNAGTILVYPGGALSGRVLPTVVHAAPIAGTGDQMELLALADVTGDGVPDVLGGSPAADPEGILNAGAFYLFPGGSGVVPPTVFAVPGALPDDRLGR